MIKMAQKFPKLRFEHCGGLWTDKDPKNAGSYFGYIDEAQHVAGIVAGYSSKSGKLGFVAAKPIPQVCATSMPGRSAPSSPIRRSPRKSSSPATGRCR
jgi:basic membrane lipoprotein Med (substrate-binding protein (PBP1-ABC) superfamily)